MPKQTRICVLTMEAEMKFAIEPETTGKQLCDQIARTLHLRELWYFGLQFVDSKGLLCWAKLNEKLLGNDIKKADMPVFKFLVKYFPEDASVDLIQEVTKRLFYLQVKEEILTDELFCPPETSVLLASYALQAKFGDYSVQLRESGRLFSDRLLPTRVLEQHRLNETQWRERIISWYSEHTGMLRQEAILEYLKVAQDLDMYGVSYFEISNKKGTELLLGIDALGLNIYEKLDRLTPRIGFPWSEIQNVAFQTKKFIIKPSDRKAPDFVFYASRASINKQILALCMGNHELYVRRRSPDSAEVKQLRAEALEEKAAREATRAFLLKERQQKEDIEKQRQELEEHLKKYEQEVEKLRSELLESQMNSQHMNVEIERLEKEQKELREACHQAEVEATSIEKAQREREVVVENGAPLWKSINERSDIEIESGQHLPQSINDDVNGSNQSGHHDLRVVENMTHPEYTRVAQIEKNIRLNDQLKRLSAELAEAKELTRVTRDDVIYMENVAQGRDKHRTLRLIQQGNTKERVDIFESM